MLKYILPAILLLTIINNTLYNSKSILILILATTAILFFSLLQRTIIKVKTTLLVISFLILSWISYFVSSTGNLGLYEVTLDSALWILFLYLIHQTSSSINKTYLYFIYTIIGLSILQSVFGIFQFLTREETRIAGTFLSWYDHRQFFPNALGLFFVSTIPFSFLIKRNWLFAIIFTLNTTALLLTFSRGALIVFILQLIAIAIFFIWQKQTKKLPIIIISLFIAFSGFYGLNNYKQFTFPDTATPNLAEKYTFSGTERLTSVSERQQFFKGSTKLIMQKPLTGFGPNSFSYVYPQIQPLFLANAPHPHNWILKIGAERGLLSLIPFLALFIILLLNILKIPFNETNFVSYLAIFGAFAHNLIDFNLNFVSNYLIFIIVLAYLFNQIYTPTKNSRKTLLNLFLFGLILLTSISWTFNEISYHNAKSNYSQQLLSNLNYKDSYQLLADLKTTDQEKIEIYLNQIQTNPFDAKAFNHLGNLHQEKNKKAYYYSKAIQTDPKNNWIYYNNYFTNSKPENILRNETPMLKLLSQYLELAKQNIHFTAQHDNIVQAQNVATIFYQKTGNSQFNEIKQDLVTAQEVFSR